ncbi:hypothetical protein NL676_034199 [Syzygium grande]|nr:hypothetical protein NL676_034199 [Syzygium grande]
MKVVACNEQGGQAEMPRHEVAQVTAEIGRAERQLAASSDKGSRQGHGWLYKGLICWNYQKIIQCICMDIASMLFESA